MTLRLLNGRLRVNLLFLPIMLVMCMLSGVESVVAFCVALTLHECAHGVAASAVGIYVRSLEVTPFGCAANMESMAAVSGGKEIAVAAAGPAINILVAAALYALQRADMGSSFTQALLASNMMLAAMNLLPALPLDGGRILACVLGLAIKPMRAARLVSVFGMVVAAAMLGCGAYMAAMGMLNPTLFLMGGFVGYWALRYYRNSTFAHLKQTTAKRGAVLSRGTVDVKTVAAHKSRTLGEMLSNMDSRRFNVVYILGDDLDVVGKVTERDILRSATAAGTDVPLEKIKN